MFPKLPEDEVNNVNYPGFKEILPKVVTVINFCVELITDVNNYLRKKNQYLETPRSEIQKYAFLVRCLCEDINDLPRTPLELLQFLRKIQNSLQLLAKYPELYSPSYLAELEKLREAINK